MYCVFLGKAVQTVNPPNASVGLSQLTASGTKDSTTFLRGDNTFASAGGDNTPAFFAVANATQSPSDDVETKVTLGTEVFDTDNAFASNRFTVPSGEAGKYFFYYGIRIKSNANSDVLSCNVSLYKNGSRVKLHRTIFEGNPVNSMAFGYCSALDLSVGDYIELYGQNNINAGTAEFSAAETYLGGHKLIGV
jgi:hypothetical protein